VVIGRARADARWADATVARIAPFADDPALRRRIATEQLSLLLDLYERGMREPLPIACDASAAYAQAVISGEDGPAAAREAWETVFRFDKEDRQPEHVLVHGDAVPLARLLEPRPRDDEEGPGWDQTETTRFGRYAMRLWRGLLAVETVSDR
jgi:exodeoxyribonuclease V gamma subunit